MVVPSLTALFAYTSREVFGNRRPVFRLLLGHKFQHQLIFSLSPRSFNEIRIEYLLPSVEALYVSPSRKRLGNFLPVLTALLFDSFSEHHIFCLSPMSFARPILVFSRADFVSLVTHSVFDDFLICITLVVVLLQGSFCLSLNDLVHASI